MSGANESDNEPPEPFEDIDDTSGLDDGLLGNLDGLGEGSEEGNLQALEDLGAHLSNHFDDEHQRDPQSTEALGPAETTRNVAAIPHEGPAPRFAPIVPRASSTTAPAYELPKRGKGTGKKRGAYKEHVRDSDSSTTDHSSRTFSHRKTKKLEPFKQKEMGISLSPDPLLDASPREGSNISDATQQPFQEYVLTVSSSTATTDHDDDKKIPAKRKKRSRR